MRQVLLWLMDCAVILMMLYVYNEMTKMMKLIISSSHRFIFLKLATISSNMTSQLFLSQPIQVSPCGMEPFGLRVPMVSELSFRKSGSVGIAVLPTALLALRTDIASGTEVGGGQVFPILLAQQPLGIVEFVLMSNEGVLADVPQPHVGEGLMSQPSPLPAQPLVDQFRTLQVGGKVACRNDGGTENLQFGVHGLVVVVLGKE
jgi:hypothetical protein